MNTKKTKKQSVWLKLLFVTIILVAVLVFVFSQYDINEVLTELKKIHPIYIVILTGLSLLHFFLKALSGFSLVMFKKLPIRKKDAFLINATELFFNGITPFSSGAPIFQGYYYTKAGVKSDDSTSLVAANFIIFQVVINIITTVFIVVFFNNIKEALKGWTFLVFIGYAFNMLTLFALLFIAISKRTTKIVHAVLNLFAKIKPLKKIVGKLSDKADNYIIEVQSGIKFFLSRKTAFIVNLFLKVLALAIYYSLSIVALYALEGFTNINDYFYVIAVTCLSTTVMIWVALPGSALGAEGLFSLLLVGYFAEPVTATVMIVWRFFSYYVGLIYGLISYILLKNSLGNRLPEFEKKTDKKRIALFTDGYFPMISGVVVSVDNLKNGLEELGYEVFIVTTTAKNVDEEKDLENKIIRINGMPVIRKTLKEYRYVFFSKKYVKQLKKLEFDLIHIHTEFSIGKLGYKYAKSTDTACIYTIHTLYEDYAHQIAKILTRRPFKKFYMKYVVAQIGSFVRLSDKVICPTQKVVDKVNKYEIEGDYEIIPSGIDLNPFYKENVKEEDINELRNSLGIKNDEFVWLYVGRISLEKSIDFLIEAFEKSTKENNTVNQKMIIVGGGPILSKLKKMAIDLKLEDKIIFTGPIKHDELGKYYQLGNFFVNASLSETQGLTYAEALAASNVLVVRYDEVFKGMIENNVSGIFYETKEELIKNINILIEDKDLREKLSKNARIASNKYSKEEYALKVSEVYKKVI